MGVHLSAAEALLITTCCHHLNTSAAIAGKELDTNLLNVVDGIALEIMFLTITGKCSDKDGVTLPNSTEDGVLMVLNAMRDDIDGAIVCHQRPDLSGLEI